MVKLSFKEFLESNTGLYEQLMVSRFHFNVGIAEIVTLQSLPFAVFDRLPTIKVRVGTSAIIPSIYHWHLLGHHDLQGKMTTALGLHNNKFLF